MPMLEIRDKRRLLAVSADRECRMSGEGVVVLDCGTHTTSASVAVATPCAIGLAGTARIVAPRRVRFLTHKEKEWAGKLAELQGTLPADKKARRAIFRELLADANASIDTLRKRTEQELDEEYADFR